MPHIRALPPFERDGVWLRCSLHAHTTESDGMLNPFMLRRYYALGGYDVLAITDHDRLTAAPEQVDPGAGEIVLIPGTEISLRAPVSRGPLHVVALGIREMPVLSRESSLAEAVASVQAHGGVAIVAHPWWSGLLPEELGDLAGAGVSAIEVYNAGCEVEQGRGNSAQYWDALLARGIWVNGVATDDHHYVGFDAFRGWTMVRAAERTPDAVIGALRSGAFYSSTGPSIRSIHFEDGVLVVESSPARSITAFGQPPYGMRVNAGTHGLALHAERQLTGAGLREGVVDGELLTRARFRHLKGFRYVRVEVTDALGRSAWSNPIRLADGKPVIA